MNTNAFPTKGNLMLAKSSLALAKQGYELMDKKRNILVRELMDLIEEAKTIQSEIDSTFTQAYQALQQANIEVGIHYVQEIAQAIPVEETVRVKTRSIMGTADPVSKLRGGSKHSLLRLLQFQRGGGSGTGTLFKGKGADRPPVHGGKFRLPPCHEYPQDPEARQRAQKHHDPFLHRSGARHQQRPGGKGTRGVYAAEGN